MKGKTRVGIFEDDKIDQYIFQRLLAPLEGVHEFYYFDTFENGLTVLGAVDFEIIVTNLHFRGEPFSGIRIFQQIKALIPRAITGIAITSYLQPGDLKKIMASGFDRGIEKADIFVKMDMSLLNCHTYQSNQMLPCQLHPRSTS